MYAEPTSEIKPLNKDKPERVVVWRNVILFVYLHAAAFYGIYLIFASAKILTTLLGKFPQKKEEKKLNRFFIAYILYVCGGLGITAGAHRLWSHKSYKAKAPLRIILMIFNTLAFQVGHYR